jgi:hypothetical protein
MREPARAIFEEIALEVERALGKFPPFNSPHEGKAVIEEELEELWDEIKADRGRQQDAMDEAVQIAAMAVRYVLDLQARPLPAEEGTRP